MTHLSSHQDKTFSAFDPIETDIDIAVLYTRVYGDPGSMSVRSMQQKLAPTFQAINNKMDEYKGKWRIEPGELKRTYRLARIKRG